MLGVGEGRGGEGRGGEGRGGEGRGGQGCGGSPQLSLLNVPGGSRTMTIDLLQFPYALVSQTSKGPPVWRVTAGCMRDILYETDYTSATLFPTCIPIRRKRVPAAIQHPGRMCTKWTRNCTDSAPNGHRFGPNESRDSNNLPAVTQQPGSICHQIPPNEHQCAPYHASSNFLFQILSTNMAPN